MRQVETGQSDQKGMETGWDGQRVAGNGWADQKTASVGKRTGGAGQTGKTGLADLPVRRTGLGGYRQQTDWNCWARVKTGRGERNHRCAENLLGCWELQRTGPDDSAGTACPSAAAVAQIHPDDQRGTRPCHPQR